MIMRKLYIILVCIIVFFFTSLLLHHLSDVDTPAEETISLPEDSALGCTATPAPSPEPTQEPVPAPPEVYDARLSAADAIISSDIESGFPGAVLLVAKDGEVIFRKAYGYLQKYDGLSELISPVTMQTDTVFDLASLTKEYATVLAVMKLIDSGLITLDSFAYEFLPAFDKPPYDEITIRQLLNHSAGFPSDIKFFRPDVEEGPQFYSTQRENTISLLSEVPLEYDPGTDTVYSDIGYMVLGAIVEEISGIRLDEFVYRYIYAPLELENQIGYLPAENGFDIQNIACTERLGNTRDGLVSFPGARDYTLQGEVHDEKAYYSMGGVSGHAGLFSDADAINVLNQLLLRGGAYEGTALFTPETANEFTSVHDSSRYQLGFSNASTYASLKDCVPENTLCHTGWTGTFSLIDKKNNLSVVLLTNKRHSPITDGDFEGASYETGKYYGVICSIYEGLGLK